MKAPWDVIAELEADNSRLSKEAIVKREALAGNEELFRGFRAAYDAMITFGVKKVDEKSGNGPGLDAARFWTVAEQLSKRELTGDAARNEIEVLKESATAVEWNSWYRRILIKDMRCGTSDSTVNKVAGKINERYNIPVFSCQLAHDSANHESKVAGKKLVEVKLDGVRVLTIVYTNGNVVQYSRNGKELVNFPHVKEQFSRVAHTLEEAMVFDGEIMSGSFQDLMKQIHRKSSATANDAVLNLFDIIPLSEFEKGEWSAAQAGRSKILADWFEHNQQELPNVTVVGQELVDLDTAAGQARYKEINAQAIAGGYEGIMLKDPKAKYECKRSVAWLKLKPFIEVSLTVVALEEGTGKNAGKLGALVCEGTDDGVQIRTNVGSGLTDSQREEIWADQVSVLGQVVEIRADAKTRNQDSLDLYSLRFPRFIRFRGFEVGEKI